MFPQLQWAYKMQPRIRTMLYCHLLEPLAEEPPVKLLGATFI
jgi:hypothetical protein